MEFEEVRRLTITALFSDDTLLDQLVLKGGNAMSLVHGIGNRFSLDLDFSLEADFENLELTKGHIEKALLSRFLTVGKVPFDIKLEPKPSVQEEGNSRWGGYQLEFKIANQEQYQSLVDTDLSHLRRLATVIGPNQLKTFKVDFSKCEYVEGKIQTELDAFTIYVYPLAMIAIEKVRALCQQMEEYPLIGKNRRGRARDFLDIYSIVNSGFSFSTEESRALFTPIFAAKEVPLSLIGNLKAVREFHRPDWPSVEETSPKGTLRDFDFYFDFVVEQLAPLHSLWEVNSPSRI